MISVHCFATALGRNFYLIRWTKQSREKVAKNAAALASALKRELLDAAFTG